MNTNVYSYNLLYNKTFAKIKLSRIIIEFETIKESL